MKFGDLNIGDLFNTKTARWVKTTDKHAICVMSGIHKIGQIDPIPLDFDVITLWSSKQVESAPSKSARELQAEAAAQVTHLFFG